MIERVDYRGDLADVSQLARRLAETGLSHAACRAKAEQFARAAAALAASVEPDRAKHPSALFVPGRIEVLGKHTDYAGGRTLVAAVERGFSLVAVPRDDPRVNVTAAARADTVAFELDPRLAPPVGHWSNYPMTVARRIARNFPQARRGADLAFSSDLPPAAGMSSSSALMVAVFLALADVNKLTDTPGFRENVHSLTDLAGYLGTIENGQTFGSLEGDRGVGTFGGSEDHTAMLCARPNQLSQYTYCPVCFDRAIPVPADYTLAVASSGVAAEKTGAAMEKYNAASRLASTLAELWRRETGRDEPHLAAVLASGPAAAEHLRDIVSGPKADPAQAEPLVRRLDHFLAENEEILPGAGDALALGDVGTFGQLVDRSQRAAEELLGNQVPETSFLAQNAREHGAAAASAFGAGFGGSVWALVQKSRIEPLLAAWAESYRAEFPENAQEALFFTTAAGPGAFHVC